MRRPLLRRNRQVRYRASRISASAALRRADRSILPLSAATISGSEQSLAERSACGTGTFSCYISRSRTSSQCRQPWLYSIPLRSGTPCFTDTKVSRAGSEASGAERFASALFRAGIVPAPLTVPAFRKRRQESRPFLPAFPDAVNVPRPRSLRPSRRIAPGRAVRASRAAGCGLRLPR